MDVFTKNFGSILGAVEPRLVVATGKRVFCFSAVATSFFLVIIVYWSLSGVKAGMLSFHVRIALFFRKLALSGRISRYVHSWIVLEFLLFAFEVFALSCDKSFYIFKMKKIQGFWS